MAKHWTAFSVCLLLKSASRINISGKRGGTQLCYLYCGNIPSPVRWKLGKNPTLRLPSSWTFLSLLLISHHLSAHYNNFHAISATFQTSQARLSGQCTPGSRGSNVFRYKTQCLRINLLFRFWAYPFIYY